MFVVRESRNSNTPKIFIVMPSKPLIVRRGFGDQGIAWVPR